MLEFEKKLLQGNNNSQQEMYLSLSKEFLKHVMAKQF